MLYDDCTTLGPVLHHWKTRWIDIYDVCQLWDHGSMQAVIWYTRFFIMARGLSNVHSRQVYLQASSTLLIEEVRPLCVYSYNQGVIVSHRWCPRWLHSPDDNWHKRVRSSSARFSFLALRDLFNTRSILSQQPPICHVLSIHMNLVLEACRFKHPFLSRRQHLLPTMPLPIMPLLPWRKTTSLKQRQQQQQQQQPTMTRPPTSPSWRKTTSKIKHLLAPWFFLLMGLLSYHS